jgi:hypothetical protein
VFAEFPGKREPQREWRDCFEISRDVYSGGGGRPLVACSSRAPVEEICLE